MTRNEAMAGLWSAMASLSDKMTAGNVHSVEQLRRPVGRRNKRASGLVSRVLSRTIIYLGRTSPCASSTQPECTEGRPYRTPICACSRWGFPSRAVAGALVRSYRTVSAFLLPRSRGVFFSVALSVGSPRPAVSWHLALGSPDFPHAEARDRLARLRTVL